MKCCNGNKIEKVKTPHIGEYCADCGKWLRWIPQNKPWQEFKMPFGKYKDKTLLEIQK